MLRKQASISQGSLAGKEETVSAETVVAADSVTASSIVIGSSFMAQGVGVGVENCTD